MRWSRLNLAKTGASRNQRAFTNLRAVVQPRFQTMPVFMKLRDVDLFLRSARTDARIKRLQPRVGAAAALEAVYAANPDPWAAASSRYRYQSRKYDELGSLLPPGRFRRALDLGCGLGLMSRRLAGCAETVLGIDVAPSAVRRARLLHADQPNIRFETCDLLTLPPSYAGSFDLIVVADVLYYLSPTDNETLKSTAMYLATLLTPGGICMLVNHYFFRFDGDSRRSRRIHDAFAWSPGFTVQAEHRRPFYLVTLLQGTELGVSGPDQRRSDRTPD
ncbi:class I SAM-dependent methyltransferase [Sphingomonas sp. TX0543]|uniref:class I SAM-dependent methyltransferase n=3 Tax=Pseudomonadota TaxID=1224 RepID=UPI000AC9B013